MKTFAANLLIFASTTCASVIPSKPNVKATYRWEKSTNGHLLALHDTNGGFLGAACSSILNATALGNGPISYNFDIERPWEGTFSAGGQDYGMFQNENNADPNCYMAYNADFIEAQCHFVAELSSSIDALESQLFGECVDLSWQMRQTAKGRSVVDTSQALPAVHSTSNSSHTTRDTNGEESRDTVAVGDGNPHQNGWNYQCNCDQSNSCASGVTTSDAFNWNFMAAATPFRWISAGFNVGQSFTTTQTQTCNAMPGQSVCVWHLEIYTAYTVQNQIFSCAITGCKTTNSGDPFVLSSPNTIQNNSHYYCVVNTCRNKKDGYFENGPPGPPPT